MKISVVTGGTSGIGAAAAELLGEDYQLLVAGSSASRLDATCAALKEKGIAATCVPCDVSDRRQVEALAARAAQMGEVANVVHAAGIGPARHDAKRVLEVDALGTAYMVEAFYPLLGSGAVMVNLSSTAPLTVPSFTPPVDLLRQDPLSPAFLETVLAACNRFPGRGAGGMAYVYAKWFVADYTARNAMRFGAKGARILSVAPGNTVTPFYYNGSRETSDSMLPQTPLGRHGQPEEVARLIAYLAGEGAGFITGVDIICDGGLAAALTRPQIEA